MVPFLLRYPSALGVKPKTIDIALNRKRFDAPRQTRLSARHKTACGLAVVVVAVAVAVVVAVTDN